MCVYKVATLLEGNEQFEEEISDFDRNGECEDKFESVGNFIDASGSQALVADELLLPTSASILALAQGNPDPAERDSLFNPDFDLVDGKCYVCFVEELLHGIQA